MSDPHSGALAAVDMGSNSFRLEIAQLQRGRYKRLEYFKQMVRLGGGLDADGMLTEEATQRGLACLRSFSSQLAGFAPAQVRAVATQTLREARNRNAFLLRAQQALGFPIEVISGREEARLIYTGVAFLQPSQERRLVIDIGGRSTEMILGEGAAALKAESFGVGCVSLTQRFFPQGRLTEQAFRDAQVAAGAELEEGLLPFARQHWRQALGSSGTAGAVSQVLQAAGIGQDTGAGAITPEGLRWCIQRCIEAGHIDAISLPGLKPERHAVLPGGLAILYTLMANFKIDALHSARGALRQGVIIELHARLAAQGSETPRDMRDASVHELQRRFDVDAGQAKRVADVALTLFDQAVSDSDSESRRELAWACALHETGLMVSHHDHHRHSAYVLAHVDAPGFSQSQQRRIADMVLGQRGGLRKIEAHLVNEMFAWQVLCLRLAVIKCHARGEVSTSALTLHAQGREARLNYTPAWLDKHPRTVFLLQEDAAVWARSGPLKLVLPG